MIGFPKSFKRDKYKLKNKLGAGHSSVCWIGDSITSQEGDTGYGYTTLVEFIFNENTYTNYSCGGKTTKDFINCQFGKHDVTIIALGFNDARYFDSRGAQSESEYISNISNIAGCASGKVAIVSIWPNYEADAFSTSGYEATKTRIENWNDALLSYCKENNIYFIDTYSSIRTYVNAENVETLFVDGVHPSNIEAKKLYGWSFLLEHLPENIDE